LPAKSRDGQVRFFPQESRTAGQAGRARHALKDF
jgi:hypothetical protein